MLRIHAADNLSGPSHVTRPGRTFFSRSRRLISFRSRFTFESFSLTFLFFPLFFSSFSLLCSSLSPINQFDPTKNVTMKNRSMRLNRCSEKKVTERSNASSTFDNRTFVFFSFFFSLSLLSLSVSFKDVYFHRRKW